MGWREALLGADGKRWEEKREQKATREKQAGTVYYEEEWNKPKTRKPMSDTRRKREGLPAYKEPKKDEGRGR